MYFAVKRVQIPTHLHIPMGTFNVNFTTIMIRLHTYEGGDGKQRGYGQCYSVDLGNPIHDKIKHQFEILLTQ